MRAHEDFTKELSKMVETYVTRKLQHMKKINITILKRDITKILRERILEKTQRKPMIMPVIMTVEKENAYFS